MTQENSEIGTQTEDRVRTLLKRRKGFEEKRMFGGLGFLLHSNMCCGVHKGRLILRLGIEVAEEALRKKHVKPFDITGRPMRGWVMIECRLIGGDENLKEWVLLAVDFCRSLPPK
ncbi:TfoX/Sxy family protein [Planctomycetaceae bacterium]|nr:TfoX/Sxy family protein [Planctomycetaceae bacterium]MDC0307792.1 TfoX/Sxy family protein [Planctomycetaceae bacterium]MDG2389795.1 TfoX/Sxy family protein [Planctomycetaceae bacterium]